MSPHKGAEGGKRRESYSLARVTSSDSVHNVPDPNWWDYRHEMDLTEEEYRATKREIDQVEKSNQWVPLGTSGALTDRPSARRPRWDNPDPTHRFGGGVFGEEEGLALSGIGPRNRRVVGMDVDPVPGQRVVGAEGKPFAIMGIGTVVWVGEEGSEAAGMCAVRWDMEHSSGRAPMEYCCGRGGTYHLEECIAEDDLVGERYMADEEPRMFGRGIGLVHGGATKTALMEHMHPPASSTNGPPGTDSSASDDGDPQHRRPSHSSVAFATPSRRSPSIPASSLAGSPSKTGTSPNARSRGMSSDLIFGRHGIAPSPLHDPAEHPGGLGAGAPVGNESDRRVLLNLFARFAKGMVRKRFHGYDKRSLEMQKIESLNLPELTLILQVVNEAMEWPFYPDVVTEADVAAQYSTFAAQSDPMANGELDFDRFLGCLESITLLIGLPFAKVVHFAQMYVEGKRPNMPKTKRTQRYTAFLTQRFDDKKDNSAKLGEQKESLWDHPRPLPLRHRHLLQRLSNAHGLLRGIHLPVHGAFPRGSGEAAADAPAMTSPLLRRTNNVPVPGGQSGKRPSTTGPQTRRNTLLSGIGEQGADVGKGANTAPALGPSTASARPKMSAFQSKHFGPPPLPKHGFTSLRNEHNPLNQTNNRPKSAWTFSTPGGSFDAMSPRSSRDTFVSPLVTPRGNFPNSPRSQRGRSISFAKGAKRTSVTDFRRSSFDTMLGLGPPGSTRKQERVLSPPGTHPLKPASSSMVARIPLVGTTFLAPDLKFCEEKDKLVAKKTKTMVDRRKEFEKKMFKIHEKERNDRKLYHEWSRMFIITREVNPWYQGPEVRFWATGRSGAELAQRTAEDAHRIMKVPQDTQLEIKFNVVARSQLIAGAQAKWMNLDEETLTSSQMLPGGGKNDPGTYLKCIRMEDRAVIKDKSRKIWSKMSKVVKEGTMSKRAIDLTGLTAATNWSMMKTLQTGNRDWIDGVASRAKLKATITQLGESFRMEKQPEPRKLDRSVEKSVERAISGDASLATDDVGGLTATLSNLIWNARFMAVSKAPIKYTAGKVEAEIEFLVTSAIGTCKENVECQALVVEPVVAAMPMWAVLTTETMSAEMEAAKSPSRVVSSALAANTTSLETIGIDDEEDGRAAGGANEVLIGMESMETLGMTVEETTISEEPSILVGEDEKPASPSALVPTVVNTRGDGEGGGFQDQPEDADIIYTIPGGQLPSTLNAGSPSRNRQSSVWSPKQLGEDSVEAVFGADKERLLHFTAEDWEAWNSDESSYLLLDEEWWSRKQIEGKAILLRFCWSKSTGPDLDNEPWVKISEIVEDLGAAAVIFVLPDNWSYIPDMVMESAEEARDIEIPVCFVSCSHGRHLALNITNQKSLKIQGAELKALELNDEFAETRAPF